MNCASGTTIGVVDEAEAEVEVVGAAGAGLEEVDRAIGHSSEAAASAVAEAAIAAVVAETVMAAEDSGAAAAAMTSAAASARTTNRAAISVKSAGTPSS